MGRRPRSTPAARPRLTGQTVRLRLTVVYGGLFLLFAAVLLTITAALWGRATGGPQTVSATVQSRILGIPGLFPLPNGVSAKALQIAAPAGASGTSGGASGTSGGASGTSGGASGTSGGASGTSGQARGAASAVPRTAGAAHAAPVLIAEGQTVRAAGFALGGGNVLVATAGGGRRGDVATARKFRQLYEQLTAVETQQHASDLRELLLYSGIALAIVAILSIVLSWLTAGRVLRPLRTITAAAREISATNLHERLALDGPRDELRELGDTFDQLLDRLEQSFEAQRRFVANASHELRTPLATMRASIDVAVGKPGAVPQQTIALAGRLRDQLDQVDRLLESFLALARAEHAAGESSETLSLAHVASSAVQEREPAIGARGLAVRELHSEEAWVLGSATLVARMVGNLLDNAVRHNERGGWIEVRTEAAGGVARLVVENGGAVVDERALSQLAQPFRKLAPDRTASDVGLGLGLSIVSAIARACGGRLELNALDGGGVRVAVELPLAGAPGGQRDGALPSWEATAAGGGRRTVLAGSAP